MKFAIPQKVLASAISAVAAAVPSRPSKPVLANILLVAEGDGLTLASFDEAMAIRHTVNAAVEVPGAFTLPAKLFDNIVSRLPNEDLTVVVENDTATLECSTGQYQIRGMDDENWPDLPTVDDGKSLHLASHDLVTALRNTAFATSGDETKQVLTGVNFNTSGEDLECAATDGHRLAVLRLPEVCFTAKIETPVILPRKALDAIAKALANADEMVKMTCDRTIASITIGNTTIISRLIEGQYPNYPQLVPKQFERTCTVDRKALLQSLERIAVMADQKNNIITLDMDGLTLSASVEAMEVGSGKETLTAQLMGNPLRIAFNVKYLIDGLKAIDSGEVQIQANTPTSPAVIKPLGATQMTYLLMPVQIRSAD